jgi:hypothetical protein
VDILVIFILSFVNFTFNPSGLVGELQSNTTNDGLFSLDFEFNKYEEDIKF